MAKELANPDPDFPDPLSLLGEVAPPDPEVLEKARAKLRALIEQEHGRRRQVNRSANRSAEAP
jgi:hypothetical protein